MPKKTLILLVTLAIITGGLIYMALTTSPIPPTTSNTTLTTSAVTHAVQRVKKTAILYFNPGNVIISPTSPTTSTVDVMVKTDGQMVSGAQLELLFDPKVVTNLSIDSGSNSIFGTSNYFVIPQNIDYTHGRATYTVGINPNATPNHTEGKIASITFSAKENNPTQHSTIIKLLSSSQVTQEGKGDSILQTTEPLTIQFLAQ